MDQQKKVKKIALLRGSVRPAKRALLATIKRRIKDLFAKKEASKDPLIQAKYDKEIKSARGVIGSLKSLQTSEIIKFGLHTDCEQMQAILQKGQADLNTRALARLCSKAIMQKAFQEFKVNNPDWEKIPISEFKVGKGVKKSKNDEDNKTKGRKGLRPRKQTKKEISTDQKKVEVEKSPKKKFPVKKEVKSPIKKEAIPSPIKKEEKSPAQSPKNVASPKKVPTPKKAATPKKQAENVDESKDVVKSKLAKKNRASASPVAATPSPAKKLNKKRKASETASNVSSGRESTGLPDKTPKRVKFNDELTKTQENKSQPDSTPKSALKPIIKKTPSDTKQKIQKSTRGNSLLERRTRRKISM